MSEEAAVPLSDEDNGVGFAGVAFTKYCRETFLADRFKNLPPVSKRNYEFCFNMMFIHELRELSQSVTRDEMRALFQLMDRVVADKSGPVLVAFDNQVQQHSPERYKFITGNVFKTEFERSVAVQQLTGLLKELTAALRSGAEAVTSVASD